MKKIGFIVNPIAGMGGKVGLKGTDGVFEEALRRGGEKIAPIRAKEFLRNLKKNKFKFLTWAGEMGEDELSEFDFEYEVFGERKEVTTARDTKIAAKKFDNCCIIVFCGGDGTARDIFEVVDAKTPILGIPAGVKMHSSVFAVNPKSGAEILQDYLKENVSLKEAEIMDVSEEDFRRDILSAKLFGYCLAPSHDFVQGAKEVYHAEEEEYRKRIAQRIVEDMEDDTYYILGPGTTVMAIAEALGEEKTLLGVDIFYQKKLLKKDVSEKEILKTVKGRKTKIIVSPIGNQGFVFGRGNQQISLKVLELVGRENIVVVSTPIKLQKLDFLRIDLDNGDFLKGYTRVVTDYNIEVVKKMI